MRFIVKTDVFMPIKIFDQEWVVGVHKAMVRPLREMVNRTFQTEGNYLLGRKWAPLSLTTIMNRAMRGGSGRLNRAKHLEKQGEDFKKPGSGFNYSGSSFPILRDTGEMFRDLLQVKADETGAIIWTGKEYAKKHQSSRASDRITENLITLKRRQFLPENIQEVPPEVLKELTEIIKEEGFKLLRKKS